MIELEYDKNCLVCFEIKPIDDSFDHEFGREKITGYELSGSFHVIVYIKGMDYDITGSLGPKELAGFKEWALSEWQRRA